MEILEAIDDIVQQYPGFNKEKVQDVLLEIINYQSSPSAKISFDPENSMVAEAYWFLKENENILALCEEKSDLPIVFDTIEYAVEQNIQKSTFKAR